MLGVWICSSFARLAFAFEAPDDIPTRSAMSSTSRRTVAPQEEHLAQQGYHAACCACHDRGFKDLSSFAQVGRSDSYATEFDLEADECLT